MSQPDGPQPPPLNASAPGHALTFERGAMSAADLAHGKTAKCRTCLRTFFDPEDADATRCGGPAT